MDITPRTLLCLLIPLALTSCAYYGDIHGHSHQLTTHDLSQHHSYPHHPEPLKTSAWWKRFNDPELNQLIATALQDSPNMQIAAARLRRAQQIAAGTASALWPYLDINGYLQRQRFSQFGLVPPPFNGKVFNIGDLGLNFNYELDFWGKNREALKASLDQACSASAEFAESELIISTAVANAYLELKNNISQVKIANDRWKINEDILKIARDRYRHGINSEIPVNTIQSNAEAAKQLLEQYRQAAALARYQLAVLLGKNPLTTSIEIENQKYRAWHATLPSSIPAHLLANRPDIYAAKYRLEAAASQIKVAKARFFPDINLNAFYAFQSVELNKLFLSNSKNWAVSGAVDLPIFDAGERRANLGVKYAEYDMAVNEYNQTLLSALQEVAASLASLRSIHSQLIAQHSAFQAIRRKYQLDLSRYRHGIEDYSQLIESKETFLQEQARQLDLQMRHHQAVVAMLKALGGRDG